MDKVGFVILHYLTIEDTYNCIESIKNNVPNSFTVIIDNGSPNKTGILLAKHFENDNDVEVIQIGKNLGFSQGNNVGIKYLLEKIHCDFIVVMNNDVLILQNNFHDLVREEYENSDFTVLGPKVITNDGLIISNPVSDRMWNNREIDILILKRMFKLALNYIQLEKLLKYILIFRTKKNHVSLFNHQKRYEGVKLHGCCLIFSQKYFDHYTGLDPDTFLYFEEDLLYNNLLKKNLLSVYNPKIEIRHLEDSATNAIESNHKKKNRFILRNEIKSLRVLRQKI